jgi:CubicO group peptidase (beta-lactamase class C family)
VIRRSGATIAAVALLALMVAGCATTGTPEGGRIERLDGTAVTPAELTRGIEELVTAADVHGLAVTVFDQGRIAYSHAFGFADAPGRVALATDAQIYGASLSKPVFAVMVMRLVEQGVLDLDTPLAEWVGEPLGVVHGPEWHQDFSALDGDPRLDRVTARHALAHTTGLPNWRWFEDDQRPKFHFEPGARYAYSGEGMVLLQIALEKLTGEPLEQLMRREVFEPYGMVDSSYTWQPRFDDMTIALGHRADGTTYPKDTDNAPRAPSTLETTPDDLARFFAAVLRGEGLSDPSWREMFRPQVRIRSAAQFGPGASVETDRWDEIELSYGLGWGLIETPHGWAPFKEGHGDGFQHYAVLFPDRDLGVMLLSNSDHGESAFDHLLRLTIADPYTPLEWEGYVPFDQGEAP